MSESMSEHSIGEIRYRVMTVEDIGRVPLGCQGTNAEIEARIRALGSTAILAFDGDLHVAQLQFRRYDPTLRSPDGLWDPMYWGDFGAHAPRLPENTLSVFCYHVGQLEDSEQRDPRYQGRGIGLALLDFLIEWARGAGFDAIVAKATPSARKVMTFMGGQPVGAYLARGFEVVASWVDPQLGDVIEQKGLLAAQADPDRAARISCCVKRFQAQRG
jgi:GNAT superfamily N-acetyltransferase